MLGSLLAAESDPASPLPHALTVATTANEIATADIQGRVPRVRSTGASMSERALVMCVPVADRSGTGPELLAPGPLSGAARICHAGD